MLEVQIPDVLVPYAGSVRVALVLGSGFGGLVDAIEGATTVAYSDVEGVPKPPTAVSGHSGSLVFGAVGGVSVCAFAGRVHKYQGVTALDAAYPSRLASALGAETIIVTNAAGGLNPELGAGDVVLISDQLNLTGDSPLVGWAGPEGGTPFVSMRDAYDPELRALAHTTASRQGLTLVDGVYAGLLGPAYETPAEVAYLRTVGADVVGMSTVLEVIAARALGLRVLGLSLVANAAAEEGLSHAEVLEAGQKAQAALSGLVVGILGNL